MIDVDAAVDERRHRDLLRLDLQFIRLDAFLGQHAVQHVVGAGEPGGDGLALEVLDRLDRPVLAGDEDERGDLVRHADADDRQPLVAGGEHAVGAAGQAERVGAGCDQVFGEQVGAAGIDGEIDAFRLVVALGLPRREAGELRLRQPFQAAGSPSAARPHAPPRQASRLPVRWRRGRRRRGVGSTWSYSR